MPSPPAWLGHSWLAPQYLGWLGQGLLLTAWLALLVCVLGTLLGIVLTALADSQHKAPRYVAQLFLTAHRNTPLMVQLLLWYFGMPSLLPESALMWLNAPHALALPFGLQLPWPSFEFLAALLALSCYGASFIAGELAAGLNAVPRGQREAAKALGLTALQAFRWVILPQALVIVRRPLLGQYTGIIKNTSLTMAIGVAELSYRSRQVESQTLLTFQAFAVATVLYLALILLWQLAGRSREPAWRGAR
ncbi:Arginine transport system permease protein ArtQ [Andreprevotia sp. IGB-42]|uniref:amino acid ABC transporter permease n=1 Tax=Andreprevotia sp. IGB-42 TaxID=2497473 RepID=UPI00135BBD57|nr:amino acid ABC transporter permease [Andreprevotia sp. IGB-42]KAF0812196.1 Arginine transport system permease protein ArtQ [Andreprevotia sp. IGB-42]